MGRKFKKSFEDTEESETENSDVILEELYEQEQLEIEERNRIEDTQKAYLKLQEYIKYNALPFCEELTEDMFFEFFY